MTISDANTEGTTAGAAVSVTSSDLLSLEFSGSGAPGNKTASVSMFIGDISNPGGATFNALLIAP